jgi:hypothetical protein
MVFASLRALGAGLQLAAAGSHGTPSSTVATTAGLAAAVPMAAYLVVTVALQARLGWQWPGRVAVVCGASVLVLLLGGLAGDLGVGLATMRWASSRRSSWRPTSSGATSASAPTRTCPYRSGTGRVERRPRCPRP